MPIYYITYGNHTSIKSSLDNSTFYYNIIATFGRCQFLVQIYKIGIIQLPVCEYGNEYANINHVCSYICNDTYYDITNVVNCMEVRYRDT